MSNAGHQAIATVTVTTVNPGAVASLTIPGQGYNVEVADGYAYIASGTSGLAVVDVTNPAAPAVVTSFDTTGTAYDVRLEGDRAYVADGTAGLLVFDIGNPLAPTLMGSIDTPGEARDLIVKDGFVYIADAAGGLQIVDARNPTAPVIASSVGGLGALYGVAMRDDILAAVHKPLGGGPASLSVVLVVDPTTPTLFGTVQLTTVDVLDRDLDVDLQRGGFAHVTLGQSQGWRVVDISNSGVPVVVGGQVGSASFGATDVMVDGDFAFYTDRLFPFGGTAVGS